MNDVTDPEVSAGSNHVGASEMWMAQVICPTGASARPTGASARPSGAATAGRVPTVRIRTMRTAVERLRTVLMEVSFVRHRPFSFTSSYGAENA